MGSENLVGDCGRPPAGRGQWLGPRSCQEAERFRARYVGEVDRTQETKEPSKATTNGEGEEQCITPIF